VAGWLAQLTVWHVPLPLTTYVADVSNWHFWPELSGRFASNNNKIALHQVVSGSPLVPTALRQQRACQAAPAGTAAACY